MPLPSNASAFAARIWLERADAGRDDDGARLELDAVAGLQVEPVAAGRKLGHLVAEVELGPERFDLLQQVVGEFLARAHRYRRDVVDRFVRVELRALAARLRDRVHDMGLQAQQAEFEYLEQAARARADDDDVCLDQRFAFCVPGAARDRAAAPK